MSRDASWWCPVDEASLVVPFAHLTNADVTTAGGKNASLGELISALGDAGVRVPDGFAVTAAAYWTTVDANALKPAIEQLATTPETAGELRAALDEAQLPDLLDGAIRAAYARLCSDASTPDVAVAVRSSATAEDLPDASFAGQQESFLNVSGADAVVDAYRRCLASLFTDRAVAYREEKGFDHRSVALSVGVQRMVRSDVGASGVMFTIDPETGFDGVVLVDAAWGLGEAVVKGEVDTDRFLVAKALLDAPTAMPVFSRRLGKKQVKVVRTGGDPPTVLLATDDDERASWALEESDVVELARVAVVIERHYGRPMDIEWAKDGVDGSLFIVQARPETVRSQESTNGIVRYSIAGAGPTLVEGLAVGDGASSGRVVRLESAADGDRFSDGDVLVATTTDPDWVPVIRRAAAVVTDRGGRTSHAAIVCRELGVPAVVGAATATATLEDGRLVTVSCVGGGTGRVFDGAATITRDRVDLGDLPPTRTKVKLNQADPDSAMSWWRLPADGIGLARMEFIVGEHIGVHPMALAHPELVSDPSVRSRIAKLTADYDSPADFFVERLAEGVATLAVPWHPRTVVLRMSDFKTDEYAALLGGSDFEPVEANPMLGWRGASRYDDDGYRDGFRLECRAVRRVREHFGLTNVAVMIPFCRTPEEADRVLAVMASEGLVRGRDGLEVLVMAEVPSNIIRAEEFAARFDGFSIGSNDLTQLTLGVDRNSERLAPRFGADDPAVLSLIRDLIERAHAADRPVGFCGLAPSNDPEYARVLVDAGNDSVSVSPDRFVAVVHQIAAAEQEQEQERAAHAERSAP